MRFSKLRFVRHQIIGKVVNVLHCGVSTDRGCSNAIALAVHFSGLVSRQSRIGIGICEYTIDRTNATGRTAISLTWDSAPRHV